MVSILSWHELYRRLVDQLRERFPEQLSDDPTIDELIGAVGLLEYVSPPEYFPHPGSIAANSKFADRRVDRRDIIAWAETDGPLRDSG